MRLERREPLSGPMRLAAPAAALLFTLIVAAVLVAWADGPVVRSMALLIGGGFASGAGWMQTLARSTPLVLTGLSFAVAMRAGLFNFGGEGQLLLGAIAAVAVGGLHGGTGLAVSPWLLFPAMMLAAALAGAAWLLGPAWLKIRLGVDEMPSTLLLNVVAMFLVSWLLDGPAIGAAAGRLQGVELQDDLRLARFIEGGSIHTGLFWAWALALLVWATMRFTTTGFEFRSVGASARAARFAGMRVGWITAKAALISGALAGLAGAIEVAGRTGMLTADLSAVSIAPGVAAASLMPGLSVGLGSTGILVALLAGLDPLGIVLAATVVAGMLVGADAMSAAAGVPASIGGLIVSVAWVAMLVSALLARHRVVWRSSTSMAAS